MLDTLIVGWILTWFDLDNILIDALNQIFETNYTVSIYWLFLFIIGAFVTIIENIK